MSVLGHICDIGAYPADVRFRGKTVVLHLRRTTESASEASEREQRRRHFEAERLRDREVDHQLERLEDRHGQPVGRP